MSHNESQYICCDHTKIFSVFTILLFYILGHLFFKDYSLHKNSALHGGAMQLMELQFYMSQFCTAAVFNFLTIVYCYMVPKWGYLPIL
jgi:hypothetical protein